MTRPRFSANRRADQETVGRDHSRRELTLPSGRQVRVTAVALNDDAIC